MKRLLISLVIIAGFLTVPFIHVQAQGALEFDHVQIDIWPEYDQPTVLIIYKMTLAASVTMPAQVTLRIPKTAGQPSSVAMQDVDNLLYNLTYTSIADGDWIKISFTAPSPNLQIEYYDPGLTKTGANRSYQYTWPGDYKANDLVVRVQQPLNASQMSIQPIQGITTVGDDTLTYYANEVGAVALGTTFTVKMSYVKPDDQLSSTLGPVKVPTPVGQAAPAFLGDLFSGQGLVMVIALVGLALIGGGVTWFFLQRRASAAEPARKRHAVASGPVRRVPQENGEDETIFCHQCGKRAGPGDVFCRAAGRACMPEKPVPEPKFRPPARQDFAEIIHGMPIPDPYRWLEDDQSPQTLAWTAAENELTDNFLEQIPARPSINQRMTRLWNYEKFGIPVQHGGRYFFTRNDGLQNQGVLYWMDSLDGEPTMLLDPNTLSADGTVALMTLAVSQDGRRIAYGLSGAGSDWMEVRVRQVDSAADLPDRVQWIKFSGASWTRDGRGFYYSRYDVPDEKADYKNQNYFHKLYYHRLGEPQSADTLIYERPDHKDWLFNAEVSDDGRFLIINVSAGTLVENAVFYQDLSRPAALVVELLTDFDAEYQFLGNDGPRFYFRTDLNAPLGRIIAIDITRPERSTWQEVVPQTGDALQYASLVGDRFLASYLHDASSLVTVYDLDGKLYETVALPGLGSAAGFSGGRQDSETFFLFTSFTHPGSIFRYDLASRQSSLFRQPQVDFNPQDYQTEQVFYASKDGTRIPVFLTYKKGLARSGDHPTILYGYGGFNIPVTPAFSVPYLVWMEMGGLVAVANLRGGGEYGKAWHEGGMKLKKQNVFDDFIAAAEWLMASGYTNPTKLAIQGRSNGGLLVGACMTQRPDLFGACLPAVGVMDMLRFHKFTIGWAWVSDYGSVDDPEEFKALLAYSPYHNIRPGTAYPATLVTTGDHDDRVFPAHSFKFPAALQAAQAGSAPVLIRIETRAGHGAGKPTSKQIDENTDILAFLVKVLDIQ